MATRDWEKVEKFAEGVAAKMPVKRAAVAAGYRPGSNNCYKIDKLKIFQDRVAVLTEERELAAAAEPGPVIAELMRCAALATQTRDGETPTVAALLAAARMLTDAAKLKREASGQTRARRRPAGMASDEELDAWAARWGPDS